MQTAHCGASCRLSAARRFRVVCGGTKWAEFALWRQHWPCCRPHDEWESCRDTPRQLTRAWAIFGERNLGCSCNESTSDQRDVRLQQAEPRARVSPASLRPAEVPILLSAGLVSFGGGAGVVGWRMWGGWWVLRLHVESIDASNDAACAGRGRRRRA